MKRTIVSVVTCSSLFLLVSGCSEVNKGTQEVVSYIQADDYHKGENAMEKILSNKELKKEEKDEIKKNVQEELEKELKENINEFKKGKINTIELEKSFKGIESFQIEDINYTIIKKRNELDDLISSRGNYEEGVTYFKGGNYKKSLELLRRVNKQDIKHKDAQKKIETSKAKLLISLKADVGRLIKNNLYSKALTSLKETNSYYEKNPEFEQIVSSLKTHILKNAEELVKQKRYNEAIILLTDLNTLSTNTQIQSSITKIQSQWDKEKETKKKELFSQVTIKYDDIDDMTRIVPKGYPTDTAYINSNSVSIYPMLIFSGKNLEEDANPNFRYLIGFSQDNWIFMDDIQFNADNNLFNWSVPFGDVQKQVELGGIFEWTERNSAFHDELIGDLEKIAESKNAKLRFNGSSGFRNYTITSKDKKRIKLFLDIYDIYTKKD